MPTFDEDESNINTLYNKKFGGIMIIVK